MTWNLWWRFGEWEARQPGIDAVVAEVQPDILCLQEAYGEEGGDHQADRLAEIMGGGYVADGGRRYRNGLSFSNVVVSRWPVIETFRQQLPDATGAPSHRTVTVGILDHPDRPIVAMSTHISHKRVQEADRLQQCAALAAMASGFINDGFDVILGADLNTESDAPSVRRLTEVMTDVWPDSQQDATDGRTWTNTNDHTGHSLWPDRRIDYVMTASAGDSWQVLRAELAGRARYDGMHPSDHWAVWADIQRPA